MRAHSSLSSLNFTSLDIEMQQPNKMSESRQRPSIEMSDDIFLHLRYYYEHKDRKYPTLSTDEGFSSFKR